VTNQKERRSTDVLYSHYHPMVFVLLLPQINKERECRTWKRIPKLLFYWSCFHWFYFKQKLET